MKKHVILMRGVPGSGKSRMAQAIADQVQRHGLGEARICSSDHHFQDEDGQFTRFAYRELDVAHAQCMSRFISAICAAGDPRYVIVDNTNLRRQDISPYLRVVDAYRYGGAQIETSIIHVTIPLARALRYTDGRINESSMRALFRSMEGLEPYWPDELLVGGHDRSCKRLVFRHLGLPRDMSGKK